MNDTTPPPPPDQVPPGRRYVLVIEASRHTPDGADPHRKRIEQAARSLRALFLDVLDWNEVPADVPIGEQLHRLMPGGLARWSMGHDLEGPLK